MKFGMMVFGQDLLRLDALNSFGPRSIVYDDLPIDGLKLKKS